MRRLILLPLCLVVATLTGCGQKGPLVLPPPKPGVAPAASAVPPATPAMPASAALPTTESQY